MRRGVSPLLATIILIAITIAAATVIYSYVSSISGTLGAQLSIQVQSIDLVKTPQGTVLFSISVKNVGNKPITTCTVSIWADNGEVQVSLGSLDPGQSKSNTITNPMIGGSAAAFSVGRTYPVMVTATAADGSMTSRSLTVTCSS